jgi:hypothetical protein
MPIRLKRGLRNDFELKKIKENKTAGGAGLNFNATRPTEDEIRPQKGTVGEVDVAGRKEYKGIPDFVEYAPENSIIPDRFGLVGGGVITILIDERYVLPPPVGDVEQGYFIKSCAPIEITDYTPPEKINLFGDSKFSPKPSSLRSSSTIT